MANFSILELAGSEWIACGINEYYLDLDDGICMAI